MSETAVEESLQSSNEKESLQSNAVSDVTDSLQVEDFSTSAQCSDKERPLIDDSVTKADVSDKVSCPVEQLESSSCHTKPKETDIIDKQDYDRINSDVESEESQYSEATEILLPPPEFCDVSQDEINLISLDPTNVLQDNIEEQKETDHLETTKVELDFNKIESSNMINCTTEVFSGDEIETITKAVTSETLIENNLIDLDNPLDSKDLKDTAVNEDIQVANSEQVEMSQYDYDIMSHDIKETPEILFDKTSTDLSNAQEYLISTVENKLQLSEHNEKEEADQFHEEKHKEKSISKDIENVLIQIDDEISDLSMQNNLLEKGSNQLENITNSEVNLESDKIEISKTCADNLLKELANENDSLEITANDNSDISDQYQLTNINEFSEVHKDNVNNKTSLESVNNFNTKEASSVEVKDVDVTIPNESHLSVQLNTDQEQNKILTKSEMSKINNDGSSLLQNESNQTQTAEKESLEIKIVAKCSESSEADDLNEAGASLDVKNIVTDESLAVFNDTVEENIKKDSFVPNCGSVKDNLVGSVETALQKGEEKELQKSKNLITSDNNSKLVFDKSEENTSENTEKICLSSEKLNKETVSSDSISNSVIVDNSNKIEDTKSIEDKKPIVKCETSLKVGKKDACIKQNSTTAVSIKNLETGNKDLLATENKPEAVINDLQRMKWLQSNQSSNEINLASKQPRVLPKKNERPENNLFEGTTKKNSNKRRRGGYNRNEKANAVKGLQNYQVSQQQTKMNEDKKESPSVWNNNTAKQLFPNPSAEGIVIDRVKEEENFNLALVESLCTAQQESEKRKMSEPNLKIKIFDKADDDDDQWGKVRRNLPDDDKGIIQNTANGKLDKFGRVDGYTEKHMFMGKNARRKEQEFLKSQSENKPQLGLDETKPLENESQVDTTEAKQTENKLQVRPTQTKQSKTDVVQSKPNSRVETAKTQNVELLKKGMHETNKSQERPIHGRGGNEGPPGQAELPKPGFNHVANKDFHTNVKQSQSFSTPQTAANNVGQTDGKNQDNASRNQQVFDQQRYRYPDTANNGIEKTNVQQSSFSGQDVKGQENLSKFQSASDRIQGIPFRNQVQSNQNRSQFNKNESNSDLTNKGESSDQLSKGRISSEQINKNITNHDSLNKNQYADKTEINSIQKANYLKQNHNPSNRSQGSNVQNRTNSSQAQNQGNIAHNQPNPGQNQNLMCSNKPTSNPVCTQDNTRQYQTNLSSNQGKAGQKHVIFVQNQNYVDKNESQVGQKINTSKDQENFGRNQNYYDKQPCSTLRNQEGYRSQDSCNRYQDGYNTYQDNSRNRDGYKNQGGYRNQEGCKTQENYRNQGYTDNVTKPQDNCNRLNSERSHGNQNYSDRNHENQNYSNRNHGNPNYSDRSHGNQNYSDRSYGNQNYSDRSRGNQNYSDKVHGNQNNSDRNCAGKVQDYNYPNYSDDSKSNYQNQCSSQNTSHGNHHSNRSQDNQQKPVDNFSKNQVYDNRLHENAKQIKENKSKTLTEENWDDDQSMLKCNQQGYNQRAINKQNSKVDHQKTLLENKNVDKATEIQQVPIPTSATYRDVEPLQGHLPLNPPVKVSDVKVEMANVKKIDVESRPNILMTFDGNANIQRALGLDRTTNYNQPSVTGYNASVPTTLSQLLNSSASQSLTTVEATSQIPANYDVGVVCAGGTMNVNAPPFNSSNFTTASFSTASEASLVNPTLEISEARNPADSRVDEVVHTPEEISKAYQNVQALSKSLAAAQASLLAMNVKFYNAYMVPPNVQNPAPIQNDGTIGDIQPQQNRLQPIPDYLAMQHSLSPAYQVSSTGVQNAVTSIAFDPSRGLTPVNAQDISTEAYQLNAAFQQRLSLQQVYVSQGGMYQTPTVSNYPPQQQSATNYQPQAPPSYQYSANKLHRGRGTPPNSEEKDLRLGGQQFYNQ